MTDVAGNPAFDQADTAQLPIGPAEDMLVVDLDGYEGPLDVLLTLAKAQKVDLRRISILGLVE